METRQECGQEYKKWKLIQRFTERRLIKKVKTFTKISGFFCYLSTIINL